MTAQLKLIPQAEDQVIFSSTLRYRFTAVKKFLAEAEPLRRDRPTSIYSVVLATLNREPISDFTHHFPVGHEWLTDRQQAVVAKRLVQIFYRIHIPKMGAKPQVFKKQGIISSFRFEFEPRRVELMSIFEEID